MIKTRKELKTEECLFNGEKAFTLFDLSDFDGISNKIKQFSYVELEVGQSVGYHVHEGNHENYYIISGKGRYNDNGKILDVEDGTITFTPSGAGHDLTNIGNEKLCFIALVLEL